MGNTLTLEACEIGFEMSLERDLSFMLLSLTPFDTKRRSALSVTETLPQADRLHRAFVRMATRTGEHSSVLTGSDAQRRPLMHEHQHAHILPLDLDDDDYLDHVLVWAPMGLDAHAQNAIHSVSKTFIKGGETELAVTVVLAGGVEDLQGFVGNDKPLLRSIVGKSLGSKDWRNTTPFVPPRYLKKQGRNTIIGQVQAELRSRNLPEATHIRIMDSMPDDLSVDEQKLTRRLRQFDRVRRDRNAPPQDVGFTVELSFASPVTGPIALGYGSHFGLGLFAAID